MFFIIFALFNFNWILCDEMCFFLPFFIIIKALKLKDAENPLALTAI